VAKIDLLALIEGLRDFDTALIANTLDHIDPTPAHEFYMAGSIQSVTPTLGPTVGIAVVCELDSSSPNGQSNVDDFYRHLEEMRKMSIPPIWVVKTTGERPDHECVLGDGMAKSLYSVGCFGAVTDGGVRDVKGLLSVPFAAYCKGTTIHHCALRFKAMKEPVTLGGISVAPGDIIHADAEGVIKIPKGSLPKLISSAVQMRAFEHAAHIILRRTDIEPAAKRRMVVELLPKFGFGPDAGKSSRHAKGERRR
jgi:regulator of RNase E activity RraA